MKGYPLVPGVITPGHDADDGTWHPGEVADCLECQPSPPPPEPEPLVEVKVEVKMHMRHQGSDCQTGKRQFATRQAAQNAATAVRYQRGRRTIHPFKCSWCLCWHTGNADRSENSKSRKRR